MDVYDEAIEIMRQINPEYWHDIWNRYDCPLFYNLVEKSIAHCYRGCCCPSVVIADLDRTSIATSIKEFVATLNICPAKEVIDGFRSNIHDEELEEFAKAQRFADTVYPERYALVQKQWETSIRDTLKEYIGT
jgi:hypothetical protein